MSASPSPRLASRLNNFAICLLLHLGLPLLPLLLEFLATGDVGAGSLTLATSMYAISVGITSRHKLSFSICLLICILFAFGFGLVTHIAHERAKQIDKMEMTKASGVTVVVPENVPEDGLMAQPEHVRQYSAWALFVVFLMHAIERGVRHILNGEPFWELTS